MIVKEYHRRGSGPQAAAQELLSSRENRILRLIAEGPTTKEIAFILNLSVKTVEARSQLMKKVGLHTVADLVSTLSAKGSPLTNEIPFALIFPK